MAISMSSTNAELRLCNYFHELDLLPDVPGRRALATLVDYTISRHG